MKKTLSLVLTALILGSGIAMAEQRIAVVDVPAVVAKSAQVKALKKEQQTNFVLFFFYSFFALSSIYFFCLFITYCCYYYNIFSIF